MFDRSSNSVHHDYAANDYYIEKAPFVTGSGYFVCHGLAEVGTGLKGEFLVDIVKCNCWKGADIAHFASGKSMVPYQ